MRGSSPNAVPMTETQTQDQSPEAATAAKAPKPGRNAKRPASGARPPRQVHPVLERLAELHPKLFGARFLPLKLGTFEDLMAAHPGEFEPAALKEALGQHARSTRYIECVASGTTRHDLNGEVAGNLALDHVHHAVVEWFKRRQGRSAEDLQPAMRARIRSMFLASGLDRATYAATAKVNAEGFNALLDQSGQDQAEAIARREALMRAFEASGGSTEAFADSYGMSPAAVASMVEQARDDRRIKASRVATAQAAPQAASDDGGHSA
jgi:sRNA-binding protein